MAKYNYRVKINGITYANVQSFQAQVGRASVQDPFKAGTAVISGRSLVGFVKPIIGWQVLIECLEPDYSLIADMRVADVSIRYGIVPAEDTWEIRCEDAMAEAGRTIVSGSWSSGTSCYAAAASLGVFPAPNVLPQGASPASSLSSAQVITDGNMLSVLQTLIQTEQGRIRALGLSTIEWLGRKDIVSLATIVSFTDGSLAAGYTAAKFDNVTFAALADNYATKVQVNPSGLAAQTSGTGYRTYSMDSYDVSTSQAADLAAYVRNTLAVSTEVPSSLSCLAEEQSNNAAMYAASYGTTGFQLEIILRGNRYRCVIEGVSVSATPESSRFTYYLSSSEAYNFLVLDDPVYGILGGTGIIYNTPMDYNETGYIYNDDYADNGSKLGF